MNEEISKWFETRDFEGITLPLLSYYGALVILRPGAGLYLMYHRPDDALVYCTQCTKSLFLLLYHSSSSTTRTKFVGTLDMFFVAFESNRSISTAFCIQSGLEQAFIHTTVWLITYAFDNCVVIRNQFCSLCTALKYRFSRRICNSSEWINGM